MELKKTFAFVSTRKQKEKKKIKPLEPIIILKLLLYGFGQLIRVHPHHTISALLRVTKQLYVLTDHWLLLHAHTNFNLKAPTAWLSCQKEQDSQNHLWAEHVVSEMLCEHSKVMRVWRVHVEGALVVLIAAAVSWIVPAALFLDPGEAEESCCSSSSLSQSPPSSRLARLSVSLPWSWTSARGLLTKKHTDYFQYWVDPFSVYWFSLQNITKHTSCLWHYLLSMLSHLAC